MNSECDVNTPHSVVKKLECRINCCAPLQLPVMSQHDVNSKVSEISDLFSLESKLHLTVCTLGSNVYENERNQKRD